MERLCGLLAEVSAMIEMVAAQDKKKKGRTWQKLKDSNSKLSFKEQSEGQAQPSLAVSIVAWLRPSVR